MQLALGDAGTQDLALGLTDRVGALEADTHQQADVEVLVAVLVLEQVEEAARRPAASHLLVRGGVRIGGGTLDVRLRTRRLVAEETERQSGEAARTRLVVIAREDTEEELTHVVEVLGGELVLLVGATKQAQRERRGLLYDQVLLQLRVETFLDHLDVLRARGHLRECDVGRGLRVLVPGVLLVHRPDQGGDDRVLHLGADVVHRVIAVRAATAAEVEDDAL